MSKIFNISFASVSELVATVDKPDCRNEQNAATIANFKAYRDGDWFGLEGEERAGENAYQTTARLLDSGWQRGADLMAAVSNIEAPRATDIRRRMVWTDQGDEIDMQRVYAGAYDTAWRRTKRVSVSGPVRVRIIVDSLASGSESSASMRWRGVAAMKLADALTEAGYLVEIESGFCGGSNGGDVVARTIVKPYNQPINLPVLAATTALPSFFRMHGHLLHPIVADRNGYVSGVSYSVLPLRHDHIESDPAEHLFIAPQTIKDAASASDWLRRSMDMIESKFEGAE